MLDKFQVPQVGNLRQPPLAPLLGRLEQPPATAIAQTFQALMETRQRVVFKKQFIERTASLDPIVTPKATDLNSALGGATGYPFMTYLLDLRREQGEFMDGGLARGLGLSGRVLTHNDLISRAHPDDLAKRPLYEATRAQLGDDETMVHNIRLRDAAGEWRMVNIRSRVLRRDRHGRSRFVLGVAVDITDHPSSPAQAHGLSLLAAEEGERARIGRELHDSTSQYMVAADLGLANVLRSPALSETDRARLLGVQAFLATAQAEMRTFSYMLHPPELDARGLRGALEHFCLGFARRGGFAIRFAAPDDLPPMSSDAEHALFRVAQEALMNVYRHAGASQVEVALRHEGGELVLEVRDDGVGVRDVGQLERGGIGVAGMRARMLGIYGDLTLERLDPGLAVVARAPADLAFRSSQAETTSVGCASLGSIASRSFSRK